MLGIALMLSAVPSIAMARAKAPPDISGTWKLDIDNSESLQAKLERMQPEMPGGGPMMGGGPMAGGPMGGMPDMGGGMDGPPGGRGGTWTWIRRATRS